MNETTTTAALTVPRTWIEVGCSKCGRRLQVEACAEDRHALEALRYEDDAWDGRSYTRGPLGCPWCASERGGFYDLARVGARPARPERGWEVYALGAGDLLAHVPGEGWVEFGWTVGGWDARRPCTWADWEIEASLDDNVSNTADVGESGYPPLVPAWEELQRQEAEWEAAERQASIDEWTGLEEGWSLHRCGLADGGDGFVAVSPDGNRWLFRLTPGRWAERVPTLVHPRLLRAPVDAAEARATGYPPADTP